MIIVALWFVWFGLHLLRAFGTLMISFGHSCMPLLHHASSSSSRWSYCHFFTISSIWAQMITHDDIPNHNNLLMYAHNLLKIFGAMLVLASYADGSSIPWQTKLFLSMSSRWIYFKRSPSSWSSNFVSIKVQIHPYYWDNPSNNLHWRNFWPNEDLHVAGNYKNTWFLKLHRP